MKHIVLLRGEVTLVSEEDYDYLNQWSWCLSDKGYARRHTQDITIYMHLEITNRMGLQSHRIDHKDNDPLNNQRDNIRIATIGQNRVNAKTPVTNTSGYKGVVWSNQNKGWVAHIGYNKRKINLGTFDCPIKAAKAYNRAALRLFGEYARLNEV